MDAREICLLCVTYYCCLKIRASKTHKRLISIRYINIDASMSWEQMAADPSSKNSALDNIQVRDNMEVRDNFH